MRINKANLDLAMAACGYSSKALVSASGVSRTTISHIRSGKTCRPDIAGKIAKALNVPIEQLVERRSEVV